MGHMTPPHVQMRGEFYLLIGATTNCWAVLWCSVDSLAVIGGARTPRDVLFDSLGLLFLFNLDDISGDLGFVNDDDWHGLQLGWIYEEMVEPRWTYGNKPKYEDEEPCITRGVLVTYKVTMMLLAIMTFVFPVLSAITSFREISPSPRQ